MFRPYVFCFILFLQVFTTLSQNNLAPVYKDGYWSVIDTSLNLICPYKYDEVKIAGYNTALAKSGKLFYLLKSNPAREMLLDYQHVDVFSDNLLIVEKDSLKALLDVDGNLLFPIGYTNILLKSKELAILRDKDFYQYYHFKSKCLSQHYDSIACLMNGIYLFKKDGLLYLFDVNSLSRSNGFSCLNEIHYPFFFSTTADGKKFVIRHDGTFLQEETDFFYYFESAPRFIIYRVRHSMHLIDKQENKNFDVDFNRIVKLRASSASNVLGKLFEESDGDYFAFGKDKKMGLMDHRLKVIIQPGYESFQIHADNITLWANNKKGLADKNGNILVPAEYDDFFESGNYWIVKDNKQFGVLNRAGKVLISPVYRLLEPVFSNKFIVGHGKLQGMVDDQNKVILPENYKSIVEAGKNLIVNLNDKFGLMSENGDILASPKYEFINTLNYRFYCLTDQQKKCIIDSKGKLLFPPRFKSILTTENPNVFLVNEAEQSPLNFMDLVTRFGLDSSELVSNFQDLRYKSGIINSFGQILLDPVYDPYQISIDTDGNTIIVKEEQGVLVITFDAQGKLIDKTKFRNYIFVKNEKIKKEPERSDSLPYFWKRNELFRQELLYGLFHFTGREAIAYYFPSVIPAPFNRELSIAVGPNGGSGIVSRRTGKILLPDRYISILDNDLKKVSFIRCFLPSGNITLIDTNAIIINKGISYMDEPGLYYLRVIKGGKNLVDPNNPYQLYGLKGSLIGGKAGSYKGGKWGIIDTTGKYLVKPKYSFIQVYFRNVFIAEFGGKWGVISPHDSVLVDFRYDEIRYFEDSTNSGWANIPFYKVRLKNKWGVIDSAGNSIIEPNFDEITHIYTLGRHYFKTMINYSRTPYGLVNTTGKLVLLPQYQFIGPFKNGFAAVMETERCWKFLNAQLNTFPSGCCIQVRDFSDGLSAFRTRSGWGFMDTLGNTVIQNKYSKLGDFNEGYAKIRIQLKAKLLGLIKAKQVYAIIDKSGNIVYNTKGRDCSDVVNKQLIIEMNREFTVRTLDGKKILPDSYRQITAYQRYGLYLVKNNEKQLALYNHQGKLLVPFGKFTEYSGFSEGLCYVSGKENGFIDTLGYMKFSFKCSETKGFSENLAAVKVDNKWSYIDTMGRTIIEPEFYGAEKFTSGYAKVLNSKLQQQIIDKNKRFQPFNALPWTDGYSLFINNKRKGILDPFGRIVVYPVSEEIGSFAGGYAVIKISKLFGLYDSKGHSLVKNEIPIISKASNGLIQIVKTNELTYAK
jgi:hypothetical protein